jgi:ABC-type transport system involved in cytochrome bd biosynthesis fused ATPase/permease subunit
MGNVINENKMTEVISKVNLQHLLMDRDMYADQIIDSGMSVSGGQAQRIGIARALYANAEILIFDEPTSSIDESSSIKIIQAVFEFEKDKTILLITHQNKLLDQCDTIYRISNNKLEKIK